MFRWIVCSYLSLILQRTPAFTQLLHFFSIVALVVDQIVNTLNAVRHWWGNWSSIWLYLRVFLFVFFFHVNEHLLNKNTGKELLFFLVGSFLADPSNLKIEIHIDVLFQMSTSCVHTSLAPYIIKSFSRTANLWEKLQSCLLNCFEKWK